MAIGPTRVPESVLRQIALPPTPIQAPELLDALGDCIRGIRRLHGAGGGAALVVPGTGTCGMEAAAFNFLQPGMPVAVLSTGSWGMRWASICRRLGASVHELIAPAGGPVPLDELQAQLETMPCRVVLATHVDSSTGLIVDLARLAEIAHRAGALLIVDSICGAGAERLEQRDWDVDVILSSTPKAIGVPAGLFMVTMNPGATQQLRDRARPCASFALDLQPWLEVMCAAEKGRFGYFQSPAGNLVMGLAEGLRLIFQETVPARLRRHQKLAAHLRGELARLGIEVLVQDPTARANGVTVALHPRDAGDDLLARVAERGVFLPPGTHPDPELRTFRIGHLGWVTAEDIGATVRALGAALGRDSSDEEVRDAAS